MTGRGRGRGALARWGPVPGQPFASGFDGRAVASVPPLKKQQSSSQVNSTHGGAARRVSCVRVTCIIDPNNFWAQLGSASELEHFDRYMFALSQWCDAQPPASYNEMPALKHVPVCVKHSASGTWRRAEVTRLSQRMADVFFLDYGEAECVPVDNLCSGAPSDMTAWPPQAMYCHLEGAEPANNENQWGDGAVHRFRELVDCGAQLMASHELGRYLLDLFIRDDHGNETSILSILANEGFAQGTMDDRHELQEPGWREESSRVQPKREPSKPSLDREQREQLEKLEQQLVMSGFTYLIPQSHETEQSSRAKDYGFSSRTTISSTFFQYKGKHGELHGLTGIRHEPDAVSSPGTTQFQQTLMDFAPPVSLPGHSVSQSVPSSSAPGFTVSSSRDGSRGNSPGSFGNQHASGRPHLASPGDFMSTSKGSNPSLAKPPEQTTAFSVHEEKPGRYIPPHLRMMKETENADQETELERMANWARDSNLVSNLWSPSSEQPPYAEHNKQFFSEDGTRQTNAPRDIEEDYSIDREPQYQHNAIQHQNQDRELQCQDSTVQQSNLDNQAQYEHSTVQQHDLDRGSQYQHSTVQQRNLDRESQYQHSTVQQPNLAAFQQENNFAFPQHLQGTSVFQGPKFGKRGLAAMFNAPVKSDYGDTTRLQTYTQQQQQQQQLPLKHQFSKHFEPLKVQPTTENSNDKTMKKELEWKKWKFQRNVKKVLDKCEPDNVESLGCDLAQEIADSRLSQMFEGVSEVMIMLEMILERVLDRKGFTGIAAKLCLALSGLDVTRFVEHFTDVVLAFRDDLVDQYTISNWQSRCERFCSFLGDLFLAVNMETEAPSSLKPTTETIVRQSLKMWSTTLDKNSSKAEFDTYTACLTSLLKTIGPVIDDGKLSYDGPDICEIFDTTLIDHVLSIDLPRNVRANLLELLLHRASGWPVQDQQPDDDIPSETCSDTNQDVVVEQDEGTEDEAQEAHEEPEEQGVFEDEEDLNIDESEWDPYAKVTAMLEHLKLQDLFPKFKDNCIRDTLLTANKEEFKKTLQEAGFPPGVILEIRLFLDKGHFPMKSKPTNQKPNADPVTTRNSYTNLPSDQPTTSSSPRVETPTEQLSPQGDEGRIEVGQLKKELHELMSQENTGSGSSMKRMPSPKGAHSMEGTPYSRQPSKPKRSSSEHTIEENKPSMIIDSHNTFEPSYLSRTPPLRVDISTFDFDVGPVSPSTQSPMTYSAVVKAKNEETSPEPVSKTVPVRFTALTKSTGEGNKESQVSPRSAAKGTSDDSKEGAGKRDQNRSHARPPPGFPPLPPQTWGQGKGAEIRLTVLNSKQRGKSEDDGGILATASENEPVWKGRSGGDLEGGGGRDREGGGPTRGAWRGGRGGGNYRGSWREPSDRGSISSQSWSNRGGGASGATNWRERPERQEDKPQPYRDAPASRGGFGGLNRHYERSQGYDKEAPVSRGGFGTPSDSSRTVHRPSPTRSYGGGFYEGSDAPPRPFGPGGPKACYNCGSKEHFECNDRSKMFLD